MAVDRLDVPGPSGAVAAKRLAKAGMSMVCLEQGEWPDRARFPGDKLDYELTAQKQWNFDPNVRNLPPDYPVDLTESDLIAIGNFNGVGGSATLHGGIWPRSTPDNFRSRSLHGYAEDWPLSYEELRPFYERTDREFGVSGLEGNPAYPPGAGPPLPPLPVSEAGMRVARGHARLGWHWWPDNNAIPSVAYEGRRPCVQRGTCYTGCNEGAKASPDLTHWRTSSSAPQMLSGPLACCWPRQFYESDESRGFVGTSKRHLEATSRVSRRRSGSGPARRLSAVRGGRPSRALVPCIAPTR